LLLSSYTIAIQNQENYVGNLFRQKTKAKCMEEGNESYGEIAFHYIHQNPLRAGLVKRMEDWEFSSYKDYAGLRDGKLCNKELGMQLFGLTQDNFIEISNQMIPEEMQTRLFE